MADLTEIVPVENPDARRELLEQQFDEVAETPKPERARDEQGKFAKEEAPKEAKAPKAPKAAKGAAEPVEAPEAVEEPVWKRPPASWKKDYHEAWGAADDRMKEYAWKREEEMKAGVQPFIEKARFADSMNEVIAPHLNTMRGLNIQPAAAVKALLEADHILRYSAPQEKLQYFARLAQNYGIDLGQVQQAGPVDANYYALQNELNSVRGEMAGWKQAQEEQRNQSLLGEIANFSQKAEHFEAVRPAMVQLLQGGMAQTLEEAYDKAIRLNPEIFDAVQQGKQASMDAGRRAAADSAAKRARAAAVSVKGSTPGTATTSKANDRRTMLAEQFDAINERL